MSQEASVIDYKNKRALVIDDFPGMRSAFRMALSSFGMTRVDAAASAAEAVARVKTTRYDAIISDYNLGEGRDGQQLLEEMREKGLVGLETAYLMVTAESVYERVVAAAELGPDDYLIKPFNGEILRTRIEAIIRKKDAFRSTYHAFANGDFEAAQAGCDALIENHPKYVVDALRLKGEILIARGDFPQAEALYKRIVEMRAVPWSRLGLAKALHLQKKELVAEQILQGIIVRHPQVVAAHDLLAEVQIAQNKMKEAQKTLMGAVGVSAQSPRRQRLLGEVACRNKDTRVAENAFKAVIQRGRHSIAIAPKDFSNLSRLYVEQGNLEAAAEVMTSNRPFLNESAEGRMVQAVSLAQIRMKEGKPGEAGPLLREALDLQRTGERCEPNLMLDMVDCCMQSGLTAEAEALLSELALNAHDDRDLMDRAARLCEKSGRADLVESVIHASNAVVAEISKEAALLLAKGNVRPGVEKMLEAVAVAPRNPRLLMNAAWAMVRLMEEEGVSHDLHEHAQNLVNDAAWIAPDHPRIAGLQTSLRGLRMSFAEM